MFQRNLVSVAFLASCAVLACSSAGDRGEATAATEESPLVAGSTAAGSVPAALPARMMVGLFEQHGSSWMKSSGDHWDLRYAYFTKGWLDNWGYGAANGQWGLDYMKECDAAGFVPVAQYYVLNGDAPAGDESQFFAKTQNAATMSEYFGEFKTLMQRAKDFGKPVVVILEGDGFGYMETESGNNPSAYAAVAASGLPELAGLPNTAAGWGLAFLQLRKAVGATNVILGPDVPGWATGKDITFSNLTDPIQPEVDKAYAFLGPLGLAANQTGATFDFVASDPSDRDADYYKLVNGQDRWWDASDTAPIASKSFNRYAEWLRLWNQKSGKRWLLWQIPVGNSNSLDVYDNGQARQGYKDNRPEYFFGTSRDAHLAKFADAGVMGLLFGAGANGQSTYTTDQYTDGQLFLHSRAGAMLAAGGFPIARGGGVVTPTADAGADAAKPPVDAGTDSAKPPVDAGTDSAKPPSSDPAQYGFESNAQSWGTSGGMITGVAQSASPAFAGTHSLAVSFNGAAGTQQAQVLNPGVPAGKTVTFHVWCPAGTRVSSVQPYVQQGQAGGWVWTGSWRAMASLTPGAWNTIPVTVPATAAPLYSLGVQFTTGAGTAGSCYLDSVGW